MVDRITPRTTQETKDFLQNQFQIADLFPVKGEEFIQWVIEDNFCDGRPEWQGLNDATDFMFVKDVHPFEMMKLRLLNAGHAALAYFSHLIGHTQVELAMQDPLVRKFVRSYMD
jgi:mannitol 2-dehydrogenase